MYMMGMGSWLFPALGVAQSIALIVFTFLANVDETSDGGVDQTNSTNMALGYAAGGLGVILGGMKTMMMMGSAEEEVYGYYYYDYYYYDDYYYGGDDYYEDYYGGYDYYDYY